MKKVLIAGLFGATLISCSTAKTAQENKTEFLKLKGDWEITSVNYDKSYRIKPFDEGVDAQCFVGSHWKLIPNNYSGVYTLNGGGTCPTVTQPIKFEVVNGNEFKFKKLQEGTKAKTVVVGYSLNLVNQTADSFTLEQNVPFNGNIVKVIYNFARTSAK